MSNSNMTQSLAGSDADTDQIMEEHFDMCDKESLNNNVGKKEFSYHDQKEELDSMTRMLNDLRDEYSEIAVKCNILHVDLATQFSPRMMEAVNKSLEEYEKCTEQIDRLLDCVPV